jgi:FKBP-type peptidyl-prolyl cis-trans isomerase FkpA
VLKRFIAPILSIVTIISISCQEIESTDDQLVLEVQAIDAYLKANVTDYIAYDQSGIRLVIHQFGFLPPVHQGQKIRADVRGKLFSTGNYFTDISFNSLLDSIGGTGLKYGIASLPVGSQASIYIPSKYAFGTTATNGVPPNSTLVYEVKLHGIIRTAAEQTRFTSDTSAIKEYIAAKNLTDFLRHPSGIWYKLTEPGNGIKPKPYDGLNMIYTGSLMSNDNVFDSGTLSNISPYGLIDGLKVGLPMLDEGGSAIFLIPSGLAYGIKGSGGSVPENANLKFEVELTKIIK